MAFDRGYFPPGLGAFCEKEQLPKLQQHRKNLRNRIKLTEKKTKHVLN
jgi:hypothetical protein